MRKFFTAVFLLTALAVTACWFTEANFNAVYISGVNNYISHYDEVGDIQSATYHNGQTVAMPLTVWVKVSPRMADQEGEAAGTKTIVRTLLQYKVLPSGDWVTVQEYNNPNWDMDFTGAVPLFGMGCINVSVPDGTELLIRMYVTDGTYENGDLNSDITAHVPDTATLISGGVYDAGWSAPHVMRVIIKGRRPVR